jgi:hypothetical protein
MNTKFMKFNKVHSLQEIANLLKCESIGDKNFEILGMNEIHVVEKVISFCRSSNTMIKQSQLQLSF